MRELKLNKTMFNFITKFILLGAFISMGSFSHAADQRLANILHNVPRSGSVAISTPDLKNSTEKSTDTPILENLAPLEDKTEAVVVDLVNEPAPITASVSPRGVSGAAIMSRENSNAVTTSNTVGQARSARTAAARSATRPLDSASTARSAQTVVARGSVTPAVSRAAVSARTAKSPVAQTNTNSARSATKSTSSSNVSRSGISRAAAVYDDVSKMGTGYNQCRDAYSTCMDQICAKSNDEYRRCYCSDTVKEFKEDENNIDEIKILLANFEDNNLNAVDKSAAEISSMYGATVGEQAIKKDTSKSAQVLEEISDLLSGKKKAPASSNSLGILDLSLDFNANLGDIWGGENNSIFTSTGTGQDFTKLEGGALYNAANKQCAQLINSECENDAVRNMVRNSYNVLINQDCNTLSKSIKTKKEAILQTVRTAEKYLRDARLEEYRTHNSADVNECIANVKSAVLHDSACGEGYKRCLDYTGSYINATTGDPIYSPILFGLKDILTLRLSGDHSIADANPNFKKFLNTKKYAAESALSACRDKADFVWDEFMRTALIEIAQAQDEKIEEIKGSCVATMGECYDSQSEALKSFDNSRTQKTGALQAYTSRDMCKEKVITCAALYSSTGCNVSASGKITNPDACGLQSLLSLVTAVDNVKIAEGCEDTLRNYAKDICTPKTGDKEYPYACRNTSATKLRQDLLSQADLYCTDPTNPGERAPNIVSVIEDVIEDIDGEIEEAMYESCIALGAVWDARGESSEAWDIQFLNAMFGGNKPESSERGKCIRNTPKINCEQQDVLTGSAGFAKFVNGECVFSSEWYKYRCEITLNGLWENNTCYVE